MLFPPESQGHWAAAMRLTGHCEYSILMSCPCCVWQTRFTPHPRPLSPVRGEGGLRGQRTLPVPSSTLPGHFEFSILLCCPCCVWLASFAPHPRPLSPVRGEGGRMLFPPESQGHWVGATRINSPACLFRFCGDWGNMNAIGLIHSQSAAAICEGDFGWTCGDFSWLPNCWAGLIVRIRVDRVRGVCGRH